MPGSTDRPVFNDESGVRAWLFQWGGRGLVALGVAAVLAVGLALNTHVSLPGLDGSRVSDGIRRLLGTEQSSPITTTPPIGRVDAESLCARECRS